MKKIKIALVTLAAVATLTACSTPAPTSVIEFNYQVDNAKANGIVQVFDLSGNTVVQMRDLNPKSTHFLDAKNAPIPFKLVGENAVLAGMHSSFTVSTALAASRIIRKPSAPLAVAAAAPAAVTVVTPNGAKQFSTADSTANIELEIVRMRKELAELKAMLANANVRDAGPVALAVAAAPAETAEASVVIVSFANNSRQFAPAQEQRTRLVALSHNAQTISVRGYTDSEFPTPGSTALAKARAEAAKQYLISMGVTARKIVIGYEGSGKFIAENRSQAGRAANRRVEISGT